MGSKYRHHMQNPQVKQFYESYDFEKMITGGPPEQIQKFLDGEVTFLEQHLPPGKRVLEVGCGYGRLLEVLGKNAKLAVGIDFSAPLLNRAKANLAPMENVELHLMHAERMEFEDESFDAVLCLDATFGNMPGIEEEVIAQMIRVCKRGGEVIISVFSEEAKDVQIVNYNRIGLTGIQDDGCAIHTAEGFYSRRFSKDELRRLFRGLDCKVIKICPINYLVIGRKPEISLKRTFVR